jgi:hypothetical protein
MLLRSFFSFLVETVQANKNLPRRRRNFYHHLFSTTGAGCFEEFLGRSPLRIPPGKVSPSSRHLYVLAGVVIYPTGPTSSQPAVMQE